MSTRDVPETVLESLDANRRSFIRKLIVGSPFVAPAVASFVMSGLSVGEARAQAANITAIPALPPIGLGAAATGLLLTGAALLRRGIRRKRDETTDDDESK